jgi:IS5 family transposase
MAEVGLVALAKVALRVSKKSLPAQRTKYSKKVFSQGQLLAVLCLMRYEEWTLREAEIRLSEHGELRAALELEGVPDYSTLCKFLTRLDETALNQALGLIAREFPRYKGRSRSIVAVDATGLSPSSLSTYFIRRRQHHQGRPMKWSHWLVWLVVVDLSTGILLAQTAHAGPTNNCAHLRPILDQAAQVLPIGRVLADAEFDSERNHQHIRSQIGADSVIPAKRGAPQWKITGTRAQMRENFPEKKFRPRALVESFFSRVKRKLSSCAPGRSLATQRKQALLLGLSYNLYRLWPA